MVIPLIYSNVRDFHEGLAAVRIGNWASNKWGFIKMNGDLVIPILFENPRAFSDGYPKVILNNEWIFINKKGDKVISLKDYDGGSNFHKGFAIVYKVNESSKESVYGIIDKTGTEVIPCIVKSYFCCSTLEKSVKQYMKRFNLKDTIS